MPSYDPMEIEVNSIDAVLVDGVWYELFHDRDESVPACFFGPLQFQHTPDLNGGEEKVIGASDDAWIEIRDRDGGARLMFPLRSVQAIRLKD